MDHEAHWNARYAAAGDDYVFGTEPIALLARRLALLEQGATAMSIAAGEGRNSFGSPTRALINGRGDLCRLPSRRRENAAGPQPQGGFRHCRHSLAELATAKDS